MHRMGHHHAPEPFLFEGKLAKGGLQIVGTPDTREKADRMIAGRESGRTRAWQPSGR